MSLLSIFTSHSVERQCLFITIYRIYSTISFSQRYSRASSSTIKRKCTNIISSRNRNKNRRNIHLGRFSNITVAHHVWLLIILINIKYNIVVHERFYTRTILIIVSRATYNYTIILLTNWSTMHVHLDHT